MELLDLVIARLSAIGGVLGLIAALFSAASASRSADHAKAITDRANESAQLGAWREAQRTLRDIRLELDAIGRTLDQAAQFWKTAWSFNQTVGGGRAKLVQAGLDAQRAEAAGLEDEARKVDLSRASFQRLSALEAVELQVNLDTLQSLAESSMQKAVEEWQNAQAEAAAAAEKRR